MGLLLKNVFLCCATGCIKEINRKAEVTSTIAQTAPSRKVTKDSSQQFLHRWERKHTSVTSTTGYWVKTWWNRTFITRDCRTFSLQYKPSYTCFCPQWRRIQSAYILRSSDSTVVRCSFWLWWKYTTVKDSVDNLGHFITGLLVFLRNVGDQK